MTENSSRKELTNTEQGNISEHGKSKFDDFIIESLRSGGSHIVANKSHGKTRLMFSIAEHLMKQQNIRNIIFDGSETWLYSASKIATFNIGEHDISSQQRRNTEELEKYTLENENLVKIALMKEKDILFRLKTRKPSKRGFFVRTVINYLDAQQREEKELSPEHLKQELHSFLY